MRRMILVAGLLLAVPLLGADSDWPQFRGPGGAGLSNATNLPERWGPNSSEVLWQVNIEGSGHSSPIVSNGKVFLTTAVERSGPKLSIAILQYTGLLLAALLSGYLLLRSQSWLPLLGAGLRWTDTLLVWLCLTGLAVAYWAILYQPRIRYFVAALLPITLLALAAAITAIGHRWLRTDPGRWVAALDGVRRAFAVLAALGFVAGATVTMLKPGWFWEDGSAWDAWKFTGVIASVGLVAAFAALPARSHASLIGAAILIAGGYVLAEFAPATADGGRIALMRRALLGAGAILPGVCLLLRYLAATWKGAAKSGAGFRFTVSAVGLALIAVGFFLAGNVFQAPRLQRVVLSLDLNTGETLWQRTVLETALEPKHEVNSYATPTPATNGRFLVADFGWAVVCLDQQGNLLWKREFDDYSPHSMYGAASSPVIAGQRVFVMQDSERPEHLWGEAGYGGVPGRTGRPTRIVAYDLRDGKEVWKVERSDTRDSYSTPLVVSRNDTSQLITATAKRIIAYDTATGAELWSQTTTIPQVGASPIHAEGVLWLGAGNQHIDKGGAVVAVRLPEPPARVQSEILWQSRLGVPTCVSSVMTAGKLHTLTYNGILTAYDALSGEVLCRKRLSVGEYYSSLLVADGKLYASNDGGVTTVLAPDGTCEIRAENELPEGIFSSPAVSGDRLLIRTTKRLFCLTRKGA